jgi:hypothetical protein
VGITVVRKPSRKELRNVAPLSAPSGTRARVHPVVHMSGRVTGTCRIHFVLGSTGRAVGPGSGRCGVSSDG